MNGADGVGARLFVALQYLLPQHGLSRLVHALARARTHWVKNGLIRAFLRGFSPDLSDALETDPYAYPSFNAFFTRALAPGARPLAAADLVAPVDGAISRFGAIEGDRIFQAKGHYYTTRALLGGDGALAAHFEGGHFATLYLSPKDYHRIHMPAAGRLLRMIHVPGALFSVNPATARGVPGLFARNERVVCVFDGAGADGRGIAGPWVLVLVGATIVGSMATAWHGVVTPPRPGQLRAWSYDEPRRLLAQGEEMGRFLLGSTVVLLLPRGPLEWNAAWAPGRPIRMGEAMARRPAGAS